MHACTLRATVYARARARARTHTTHRLRRCTSPLPPPQTHNHQPTPPHLPESDTAQPDGHVAKHVHAPAGRSKRSTRKRSRRTGGLCCWTKTSASTLPSSPGRRTSRVCVYPALQHAHSNTTVNTATQQHTIPVTVTVTATASATANFHRRGHRRTMLTPSVHHHHPKVAALTHHGHLQPATCNLQPATCDTRHATRDTRHATRDGSRPSRDRHPQPWAGRAPAPSQVCRMRTSRPAPCNAAPTHPRRPQTAHRTPHTAHRTPHTAHRTPHTAHRSVHSSRDQPRLHSHPHRVEYRAAPYCVPLATAPSP